MTRRDDEKLRACPTCGTKVPEIGLRDYSRWLFDLLPGRVAATDLDCIIEQHSTGRILCLEFKPNHYVPRGQALLFDNLADNPKWDVWAVIDSRLPEIRLAQWSAGNLPTWETMTLDQLRERVAAWWAFGLEPSQR